METLGEYHHFRLFTEKVDVMEFVEFLKTETDVLVIVAEISHQGHRPHIHATIRFRKSINAFRDKFRKKYPDLFGNKSYSIKAVRKYDSNIKYCLKGTPNDYPDILYTTLSVDEWKQYYNEYWEVQNEILKSKKAARDTEVNMGCQNDPSGNDVVVVKKQRVINWAQKLTKVIIRDYPLLCSAVVQYYENKHLENYDLVYDSLVSIILEHLGVASRNLDDFILLRLFNAQVNAIVQQTGTEKAKTDLAKICSAKLKNKTIF